MTKITNINSSLWSDLREYCACSDEPLYIIVPFIRCGVIDKLLSQASGRVSIVTSWKAEHLRKGVSSLELYELCKKRGWTLYVNSKIHAKIYSRSFHDCFLGSANCTDAALFDGGNIECMTFLDALDVGNRIELNKIILSSTPVDDRIFCKYRDWFNDIDKDDTYYNDDPHIDDIKPFYVFQLPASHSPRFMWKYLNAPDNYIDMADAIEHDIAIYGSELHSMTEDEYLTDVQNRFFSHPFISLLDKQLSSDGIRFGSVKEWVQNNCLDVPVPYRKDLTVMVQNLFEWFIELNPKIYSVRVPGTHSQVIYKNTGT